MDCIKVEGYLDSLGKFHTTCEEAKLHSVAEKVRMEYHAKHANNFYKNLSHEDAVYIIELIAKEYNNGN